MRRRFVLTLLTLAAALVLTSAAAPRPLDGSGSAPPDPPGDSGVAPDVTTISMANDNAGKLTWRIGLGNRPQFVAPDFVSLYIDADSKSTGDEGGFEFLIQADSVQGPSLFKWGGSTWQNVESKSIAASFAGGVLEISIDFRELNSELIVFWVYADTAPAASDEQWDEAPNTGVYGYFVQVPLLFKSLTKPARVTARKVATLTVQSWTNDQQPARVTCVGRIGGKRIPSRLSSVTVTVAVPTSGGQLLTTSFIARSSCKFAVPPGTRGRTLSARLTATKGGVSVTRTLTARVR